jgi:hypothetical protein
VSGAQGSCRYDHIRLSSGRGVGLGNHSAPCLPRGLWRLGGGSMTQPIVLSIMLLPSTHVPWPQKHAAPGHNPGCC